VSVQYRQAAARGGIRELITELGKRAKGSNVLIGVHSMKWLHLIAADCEPPRAMLIRALNEFTVGYTTRLPCGDPALDEQVEVFRTDDGQWYFRENGTIFTASLFASKLIRLIAEANPVSKQPTTGPP
jgi:hypothetical protein